MMNGTKRAWQLAPRHQRAIAAACGLLGLAGLVSANVTQDPPNDYCCPEGYTRAPWVCTSSGNEGEWDLVQHPELLQVHLGTTPGNDITGTTQCVEWSPPSRTFNFCTPYFNGDFDVCTLDTDPSQRWISWHDDTVELAWEGTTNSSTPTLVVSSAPAPGECAEYPIKVTATDNHDTFNVDPPCTEADVEGGVEAGATIKVCEWKASIGCSDELYSVCKPADLFAPVPGQPPTGVGVLGWFSKFNKYEISCPSLSAAGKTNLGEIVSNIELEATYIFQLDNPRSDTYPYPDFEAHNSTGILATAEAQSWGCSSSDAGWIDTHTISIQYEWDSILETSNNEFPITMSLMKTATQELTIGSRIVSDPITITQGVLIVLELKDDSVPPEDPADPNNVRTRANTCVSMSETEQ